MNVSDHQNKPGVDLPVPVAIILVTIIASLFFIGMFQSQNEHKQHGRVHQQKNQEIRKETTMFRENSLQTATSAVRTYFLIYRDAIVGKSLHRDVRVRLQRIASPLAVSQLVELSHQPGDPSQRSAVEISQIGVRELQGRPVGYARVSTQWGTTRVWVAIHQTMGRWKIQRIDRTVAVEDAQEGEL